MRYTLRLLTLQQFQRGTTLLCAMELLRRSDEDKWGTEPFTLGLWVGNSVTPGDTKSSKEVVASLRNGNRGHLGDLDYHCVVRQQLLLNSSYRQALLNCQPTDPM